MSKEPYCLENPNFVVSEPFQIFWNLIFFRFRFFFQSFFRFQYHWALDNFRRASVGINIGPWINSSNFLKAKFSLIPSVTFTDYKNIITPATRGIQLPIMEFCIDEDKDGVEVKNTCASSFYSGAFSTLQNMRMQRFSQGSVQFWHLVYVLRKFHILFSFSSCQFLTTAKMLHLRMLNKFEIQFENLPTSCPRTCLRTRKFLHHLRRCFLLLFMHWNLKGKAENFHCQIILMEICIHRDSCILAMNALISQFLWVRFLRLFAFKALDIC